MTGENSCNRCSYPETEMRNKSQCFALYSSNTSLFDFHFSLLENGSKEAPEGVDFYFYFSKNNNKYEDIFTQYNLLITKIFPHSMKSFNSFLSNIEFLIASSIHESSKFTFNKLVLLSSLQRPFYLVNFNPQILFKQLK